MKVLHKTTNKLHEAVIEPIQTKDWKIIDNSKEFEFKWKKEKKYLTFKIRLKQENRILGLIAIEDIPNEYRLHIRLIENSNPNKGKNKEYDYVAGCLIAYTCELAFEKNYDGFVSLKPKSEIIELYTSKYGLKPMGHYLFTELNNSETLIKKYS